MWVLVKPVYIKKEELSSSSKSIQLLHLCQLVSPALPQVD
ncbi:hypothetical protein [Enteroccous phage Ef212]|nr:hypothetical protein [Enteroccous phage Ef212]